jgi:CDP-diacylglycerol--glycerol-3-phosphate 3-phosphatidyltransferase
MAALDYALTSNSTLEVRFILDLNRSTRLEHKGYSSTAHMLVPLLERFPERVSVHMFRSPKLKGLLASVVPPRFNEGWGTWHAKAYIADDDFMISG